MSPPKFRGYGLTGKCKFPKYQNVVTWVSGCGIATLESLEVLCCVFGMSRQIAFSNRFAL